MNLTLESLLQRYEFLTGREKVILVCTTLVIIWGIWDNFIYQPLAKNQQAMQSQIAMTQTKLAAQQSTAKNLESLAADNPGIKGRKQLSQLQQSISQLQQQLKTDNKKFASPQMMLTTLRDMLGRNQKLRLIKLETQAPIPYAEQPGQVPWIYRHGLSITLSGSYFETLKYLQKLEELPWRIVWDMINYQVLEYPNAETHIRVYTLSFEETWLAI